MKHQRVPKPARIVKSLVHQTTTCAIVAHIVIAMISLLYLFICEFVCECVIERIALILDLIGQLLSHIVCMQQFSVLTRCTYMRNSMS